ncbi:Ig-like domain-containing protein, partial [Vibrio splendidus]
MDMTTLNLGGALALGQRIVISVDGTIKVLEEGQPLQAGDVVLESQNGSNEPQVSAKRFSSEEGEIELDQDIANIFAALEEGQDPTELGEEFATAAGQNGSSLASSGTIERDGEETIPGTEFVTTGFEALGMSRTQSLSLLDAFRSIEQSGSQGTDSETIGDTTAPDAPALTLDTDSGSAADDFLTNDGSFTVGGTEDGATVEYLVDGNWTTTAPVPTEGDNTITVRQTDAAGNTSGSSELTFTLDTTVKVPTITIAGDTNNDGVYNAEELGTDGTVTATISLPDDFNAETHTLTISGETVSVDDIVDGKVTVEVAPEGTVTAQITDAAGNVSDEASETALAADTEAAATITIDDDIADDDIVNAVEAAGDVTITGTVGGDAKPGDTVTLTVNGNSTDYTGTVKADGTYSVNVPGSELVADADSTIVASVSGTDEAGNPFTATTGNIDGGYVVDTEI